ADVTAGNCNPAVEEDPRVALMQEDAGYHFQATGESRAHALAEEATAAGSNATAQGRNSAAFGAGATADGPGSVALGSRAVDEDGEPLIDYAATGTGLGATAVGAS